MKALPTKFGMGSKVYSFCVETEGFVFTSGQVGEDFETGEVPSDIKGQTELTCKNIATVLEAAGLTLSDVVKTTCFLRDMADFASFNEVYAKYFTSKPARSCVVVKDMATGFLCEIEVIAQKK